MFFFILWSIHQEGENLRIFSVIGFLLPNTFSKFASAFPLYAILLNSEGRRATESEIIILQHYERYKSRESDVITIVYEKFTW